MIGTKKGANQKCGLWSLRTSTMAFFVKASDLIKRRKEKAALNGSRDSDAETLLAQGYPIDVSCDPVGYPSWMSYGCLQDVLMSSPMASNVYIHRTSENERNLDLLFFQFWGKINTCYGNQTQSP
jgi:hypothetical protein